MDMSVASPRCRGIDLQPRDLSVLCGLFDARVMTIAHIASLYFEGRQEAAKKRLQRLKAAGLLAERPRQPYQPAVLFITKTGFTALRDGGMLAEYPDLSWSQLARRSRVSDLTVRHELDVMDVKTALSLAVRTLPGFEVAEFSTWPLLYQFEACGADSRSVVVKPDGFVRIRQVTARGEGADSTFFLEVDRSTEAQCLLVERAICYRDYYRSGGLARHLHGGNARPQDAPFRVLFVFKTCERRNNMAEHLLRVHPPILRQIWLTTFEELVKEPLAAIWLTPRDYLEVTEGTAYDPQLRPRLHPYRRHPGREVLVEASVRKLPLLEPLAEWAGKAPPLSAA